MTRRNEIWPPHRPPIPVQPQHLQSHEAVRDYLAQPRLLCLICGKRFGKLGAHVTRTHLMATSEYNERFGLPLLTGLVGASTKEKLRENAVAHDFPSIGRAALRVHRTVSEKRRGFNSTAYLLGQRAYALARPRKGNRWASPTLPA